MKKAAILQTVNIKPPCKDCSKRFPACSMQCDAYKEYKEKLNDYNEKRFKIRHIDNDLSAVYVRRYDRRKARGI